MSTVVQVAVQPDHLRRAAKNYGVLKAVFELVWNALDGDATDVRVDVEENGLRGYDAISVSDNGHGISHEQALDAFKKFGVSWKKGRRSPAGRDLHGQAGEGRYAAFALGDTVEWSTVFKSGPTLKHLTIKGRIDDPESFTVSDPVPSTANRTGTTVTIRNLPKAPSALLAEDAPLKFATEFALYLRRYDKVVIRLRGAAIDRSLVEEHVEDYPLEPPPGFDTTARLTVIEWKHNVDRRLVLCDEAGFFLHELPAGIQAKGFRFTAYIRSQRFRELADENRLALAELIPEVTGLVNGAKDTMRSHFRRRAADLARKVVEQWKEEEVYPYAGQPRGEVEAVERQVFDVIALNINEYLPGFSAGEKASKALTFRMIRTALEKDPGGIRQIFEEVLNLPQAKRAELVELINRTSLTSIINASKLVLDRLDFLAGLEVILFEYEGKKKLKERKHLHRIVAENTWIFGEQYHLTVDDESLTTTLRRHLALLGKDRDDLAPVQTADGETAILDVMLSKRIPSPGVVEHLVIELKRPSVKIDGDVLNQLKKYAHAVAKDDRFREVESRWTFWALSNEIHDTVRWELDGQTDRPKGVAVARDNFTLIVKTWGEIIEDARTRLDFVRERLNLTVKSERGLEHIQEMYAKYLPAELQGVVEDEEHDESGLQVVSGAPDEAELGDASSIPLGPPGRA